MHKNKPRWSTCKARGLPIIFSKSEKTTFLKLIFAIKPRKIFFHDFLLLKYPCLEKAYLSLMNFICLSAKFWKILFSLIFCNFAIELLTLTTQERAEALIFLYCSQFVCKSANSLTSLFSEMPC